MQIQIINAYLSHTGQVVAIAKNSYFVLNRDLDTDKANEVIEKINSIRTIDTQHWTEKR